MKKWCSALLVCCLCLCLCKTQAQTVKLDFFYDQYQTAWNKKDFRTTKIYALTLLTLYQEQKLPKDADYADIESTLSLCYFIDNDFENARKLYKESFSISPTSISCNNFLQYVDTLQIGDSSKEYLFLEILHIAEDTYGKETIEYAEVLIHIAKYYDLQAPQLAKSFYEQAIKLLRTSGSLKSYVEVVLRLIQILYNYKDVSTASNLLREITPFISDYTSKPQVWSQWMLLCVRIYILQHNIIVAKDFINDIKTHKTDVLLHPLVDLCIQVADADLAFADKNYSTSESIYTKIIQSIDGQFDALSIKSYAKLQLGQIYFEQDKLQKAEILYLNLISENQTLPIRKLIAERLANICMEICDYNLAQKYYLEAANIAVKLYGVKHTEYAKSLNNLANLAFRQGNLILAQNAYLESISILKESEISSMYSLTLCNLANVYIHQGKISDAGVCYQEALSIIGRTIGIESIEYSDALNNIAIMHHIDGNYQSAYKFYTKAQQLREKILGKRGSKYLESEICLFNLYNELDISSKGKPLLQSIIDKKSEIVRQEFWHLSERQRRVFWYENKYAFEQIYPKYIYTHYKDPSLCILAYENELFVKGLLLNTSSKIKLIINDSSDSQVKDIYSQLISSKELLVYYQQSGRNQHTIDSITKQVEFLDKQLVLRCSEYRQNIESNLVDWKVIQQNLSPNEVTIEYFSAPLSQDSTMYCALLLHHNSKYPELIPLFEEKEVTNITSAVSESVENSLLYHYSKKGAELTQKVWSSVLSKINPGETIYFAPTGILHQLAIEYLPVDSARTMSDVYNMVRLSSTREIVTNKSKESYKSAVVYGGIHYDLDNETILAESNRYPEVKHRSLENDSINRGSAKFLPGTKEEAEKINKLLTDNKIEAIIYKTKSANEESFKSLSGKHNNILHIATHGFTWTDSTARKQDYFADRMKMQLIGDNQMRGPVIDPLDRCGLLFAGANTALQGKSKELPEGVQDGILTAKEISLMDLRDAELVVLSACETAKGDITSEGVFGLQRAFKMAGAKTIIMSLWKVDDNATQLLMTEFYTNWIAKRQPKREAFRNAQNTVKNKYPQPSYWAGFVMLD